MILYLDTSAIVKKYFSEKGSNTVISIGKIARDHRLRGFDAIHPASAMILNQNIDSPVLFACYDNLLLEAAIKEGLSVP